MNTVLILLGLMTITNVFINATPILLLRDKLGLLEMDDSNTQFKNRIIELLSCVMCIGFWIGIIGVSTLLTTYIPYIILYSSIISIGSELINTKLRGY